MYEIINIYEQLTINIYQDAWLSQVIDPLMEPKTKNLAYQNVVPDSIIMSQRDN